MDERRSCGRFALVHAALVAFVFFAGGVEVGHSPAAALMVVVGGSLTPLRAIYGLAAHGGSK